MSEIDPPSMDMEELRAFTEEELIAWQLEENETFKIYFQRLLDRMVRGESAFEYPPLKERYKEEKHDWMKEGF